MKRFLENIVGSRTPGGDSYADSLRELQIATAALLVEIAGVDDEFSDQEREIIVAFLREHFALGADEVDKILEASAKQLERQLDLYYFTRQINEHFTRPQKLEIIELVWKIILSDQRLTGLEDHLAHRFSRLLRLDHNELIEAKLRVKNRTS